MTSFPNTSSQGWALPALLVVSAIVYLVFVVETSDDAAFTMPLIDGAVYHARAVAALDGQPPEHKPYWQPPLYVWWLTATYSFLGRDPARVRYAQGLFLLATVALVFLIGRRMGGVRAGLAAGLIVVFNGPLLFYYGQFFPAGVAAAADVLAVWLLLRALDGDRIRDWLLCGAGTGAAALAVPNILLVGAAGLVLRVVRKGWRPVRGTAGRAAGLLVGVLIFVLPVTVRNAAVSGQFVPISTNAGVNLFIGNNARSMETMAMRPGMDWDRLVRRPFEDEACSESEAQSFFFREVLMYAVGDPVGLMGGLLRKTRLLFTGLEIPRNVDIYVFGRRSAVLRPLVWRAGWFAFPFGVLLPLAVAGAVIRHSDRNVRAVAVCVAVYAASVVLFFPTGRYRAPMIPLLAVLAGLVAAPADAERRLAGRAIVGAGVAAVLCCVPVTLPAAGVDFAAELENAIGAGLEVRGDRHGAMQRYREAIRIDQESWAGHYNLANALRLEGRIDEALEHYRRTILLRPDHDGALTNMGIALAQTGRLDEAAMSLAAALKHDPWNTDALLSLGACHIRMGNSEAGIRCLADALRVEPGNVAAMQNLAGALLLQGQHVKAVRVCREALRRAPLNAAVHNTLGMALLALGKHGEAGKHISRAAKLNPRYRKSLEALEKPVQ